MIVSNLYFGPAIQKVHGGDEYFELRLPATNRGKHHVYHMFGYGQGGPGPHFPHTKPYGFHSGSSYRTP
jgi:hypothetical protein